jgi:predicted helicase
MSLTAATLLHCQHVDCNLQLISMPACLLTNTHTLLQGIDIPDANVVVRFDPVQTPVSYVQAR